MKLPRLISMLVLGTAAAMVAGCGKKDSATGAAGATASHPTEGPMAAELAATLESESDFYIFKTAADLPEGLKWEDGSDLPEFANPDAKKGGTLNYFIQDFPRTLRTVGPDATGGIRQYFWDFVAMYPAHEHPNFPGRVFPGYAREWAADPASRTIYYRIDEEARWSDGAPITTADVVFSLYYYRSTHIVGPWYNDFHKKTWERLTIYDEHVFALTMNELRPDFLVRCSEGFYLFPKHAMADFGPDYVQRYQWRILPTTAAYTLTDSDVRKGESVTFHRVQDWWARDKRFWRGRYNPDRLRFNVIRDIDKAYESFVRGDLDFFLPMTAVPKYWYESLPDNHPDVAAGYIHKTRFFNRIPQPDWGLWMNRSKPLLDNREVRLGIQHAGNFKLVAEQYYRGDAVQMQTRSDGYSWRMHPTITSRPFNPVKAREHFAAAGFTQQGPDGILRNAAGRKLSFTLSTYRPDIRDIMSILKSEAAKAGLELNLEVLDQSTGWKNVQEKNHEIALIALGRTPELFPRYWDFYHGANAYQDAYLAPDGSFVEKSAHGTPNPNPTRVRVQTNNMTQTFIPELDRIIEAYDQTQTLEELKPLAEQIEQMIHDDATWVPGWSLPFYRLAYWRWVGWPDDFNVMLSMYSHQYFLFWIDTEAKEETQAARRRGEKFTPTIQTFDQFKEP
ncbi:MAG TPA: ABC transporter substrate-binding protein [Opitutaceae bacterium]|nr:ABC transporter substrate-binding protein [Opitutaceae bacterium]